MRNVSRLGLGLLVFAPMALPVANPHILINGDPPDPVIIQSTSFTFGANANGGGDFSFQNESGVTFTSLLVQVTLPQQEVITVGPGPFITSSTNFAPDPNGGFDYSIFFGPAPLGGIANGALFSINLNNSGTDTNGTGDWPAGDDFTSTANVDPFAPSPEPGTLLLLSIAGVSALGAAGYRHYRRASAV